MKRCLCLLGLLALTSAGCDDTTGLRRLSFRMLAGGAARDTSRPLTLTTTAGWGLTLTEARVALGPFYFNVAAPISEGALGWRLPPLIGVARADVGQDHLAGGRIIAQVTARRVVDALDPTLQPVGEGDGTSEAARSAELRLSPQAPGMAAELGGAVAVVAGEATRGADRVPFAVSLPLDQAQVDENAGQTLSQLRSVRGVPAALAFADQPAAGAVEPGQPAPISAAVVLRVDAAQWLKDADFTPLLAYAPRPGDGRYLAQPNDQVTRSLLKNLRASSSRLYAFSLQPLQPAPP